LKKRNRVLDIIIIIFIIGMSLLVFFEFETILGHFRPVSGSSLDETSTKIVREVAITPTGTPDITKTQKAAPDFQLKTLDGTSQVLSDFLGKTVMINFWATWCPPCRAELPLFERFADRYSEDFVILAINSGEELSDVQAFVDMYPYDLIFLLDPSNSAGTSYQVRGLPTSVFIDPEGFIQYIHIGQLDEQLLTLYLEELGIS